MKRYAPLVAIGAAGFIALAASGCSGSNSDKATPSVASRTTPTADGTFIPGAGRPPANFTPGSGPPPGFTPGGGFSGTPPTGGPSAFGVNTQIAAFLGISEDALTAALLPDGTSLASVAEEHGKTRAELKDFLVTARRQRLSDSVAAGLITQDAADSQLNAFTAGIDGVLDARAGLPIVTPGAAP